MFRGRAVAEAAGSSLAPGGVSSCGARGHGAVLAASVTLLGFWDTESR